MKYMSDCGKDVDPRLDVLNILIDAGADVTTVDLRKRTPLHALALCSAKELRKGKAAKVLLAAGVPPEAADADGRTALEMLSNQKDSVMVMLLSSYTRR